MANEATVYEVDPDGAFKDAINAALKKVGDLRAPLQAIRSSWFRSNRAIFAVGGPGKYQDLSTKPFTAWWERGPTGKFATHYAGGYKEYKTVKYGSAYPILRATGRLERSITDRSSPDSIARILNKTAMDLGSSVPYGVFHQRGTKRMPARPFVLLGAEQVSPPEINRRREAWIKTIEDYVTQVMQQAGLGGST